MTSLSLEDIFTIMNSADAISHPKRIRNEKKDPKNAAKKTSKTPI